MLFQLFSDLHIEKYGRVPTFPATAPYLILAGDIGRLCDVDEYHNGSVERVKDDGTIFAEFLNYVSKNWVKVFYVLGNHEFWGLDILTAADNYRTFFMKNYPNITLLDNDKVELIDEQTNEKVVVYGFTGWTNPKKYFDLSCVYTLNDYKQINGISPKIVGGLSFEGVDKFRKFMKEETEIDNDEDINDNNRKNRKIIVVTHFPPTKGGVDDVGGTHHTTSDPKYFKNKLKSKLNNYFSWEAPGDIMTSDNSQQPPHDVADLSEREARALTVWCSGHTHFCYDFTAGGVRYLSNQVGYVSDGQRPSLGEFTV